MTIPVGMSCLDEDVRGGAMADSIDDHVCGGVVPSGTTMTTTTMTVAPMARRRRRMTTTTTATAATDG
jgi:hypothetical protein